MHEKRNFILTLALLACAVWAMVTWFAIGSLTEATTSIWAQRILITLATLALGAFVIYATCYQDRLEDNLEQSVGPIYYEVDGVCFMPLVRIDASGAAELTLYYQNRYENPAHAVVHLRAVGDCFKVKEGMKDIHLAFKCGGGDFGVIHQPIRVPARLRGQVVDLKMAAACHYPRSRGCRLRSHTGITCGSLRVDWAGATFRVGVHETCGEIELESPTQLHLALPRSIRRRGSESMQWRQEQLSDSQTNGMLIT